MTDGEKTFQGELKVLMEKHHVVLIGWPEYDGKDNYCGTDYEFSGKGWSFRVNELKDA